MNNSIRWLLTETRLTGLDTDKINIVGNKLICYHLTSKYKWIQANSFVQRMDSPPPRPDREILPTDTKAQSIVKRITNATKNQKAEDWQIEEFVVEDMLSDPFTDTSGFTAGGGDYHGKGLYTCYKFNPKIASHYGNICLVFEIDTSNFLITFEDLAKQVHGENWKIKDQLLKFYKREERSEESIERFKRILADVPDNKIQMAKTIQSFDERTAGVSQHLLQIFGKNIINSLYEGVILFGTTDGPVCVSFYPKYDSKLIGLGRLNPKRPSVVDWYDSLNDFVGGRAKLKQDFETLNAIAEENTDPQEKEEMKKAESMPFDVQYIEITNFFQSHNAGIKEQAKERFFNYYQDIKSSNDEEMLEFFLMSFKNSRFVWDENVVKSGPLYNEIIDQTISFLFQNNALHNYFLRSLFESYLKYNLKVTDFFLTTCIKNVLSEDAFKRSVTDTRDFYEFILKYTKSYEVSPEIKKSFNARVYQLGPQIVVSSCSIEKISNYYRYAEESQKSKVILQIVEYLPAQVYPLNWDDITPENRVIANELVEKVIDQLKDREPLSPNSLVSNRSDTERRYDFSLLMSLFNFLPKINYFSSKANEYLANAFLNNLAAIKDTPNKSFFANISNYLNRELDDSNPAIIQIKEIIEEDEKAAEDDINKFLYNLRLGVVTKKQLATELTKHYEDLSYIGYLSRQSSEWFTNFVKLVISNASVIKQVLGQKQTDYIIALIKGRDIVLTKEEQLKFISKIGKSHHSSKNYMASYKHIDPDVFIKLLEPDMTKGGMGAGLSFKGFEFTPGVYRLLFKHRSIVNLFARAARPGLFKMIILNLASTLAGDAPEYTWAGSGKLREYEGVSYIFRRLPYINYIDEETTIPQIININDIEWFEYFLKMAKSSKVRGLKGAIAKLEKQIMNKKGASIGTSEAELDLSHREIVGNTLKEVYNF